MDKKRVLMKDVAAAAKASKSTVSMALRNDPRISAARTDQIQKIAKKMGYVPDPALAALSGESTLRI